MASANMTAAKRDTLKKMETVLRRFKLHEIEKHLFHHFTQKSWDDIVDKFGESEVPVNTRTIANFFCKAARKMNTTDLFELGEICSLFDMHLHSLKKMWYLMELSGGESIGMVSSTEMKEHIMEECAKLRLPVHITILRQQSIYWLSVRVEKDKSKRKGTTNKYYAPIFFAIPIDEPFMYTTTTKTRMTKGLVRAVANAIGYNRASFAVESGRDFIAAKERMRWKRQRRKVSVPALPVPKFKFVKMLNGNGFDFSNHAAKVKYMDSLYGPDPPPIARMHFTTKTFAIGRTQGKDEWSKIRLKATLVLKSDDVVKLVKRLTLDSGVFKFPPPARVTNYFKDLKEQVDDDSDD